MNREIKFRAWYFVSNDHIDLSGDHPREMTHFKLGDQTPHKPIIDIMQFTGLHDKHGTEIYEGDILKSGRTGKPFAVNWQTLKGYDRMDDEYDIGVGFNAVPDKYCEVIGNIYENPKLVEVHDAGN